MTDPDPHPGPLDPDPYPFQPNIKLNYTFFQKISIPYTVQNIDMRDTYVADEKDKTM
jgi:hypothetical protein